MERSILEWSVRALLMAVWVGLMLAFLRVRTAALRHAVWTAVMVAMLSLPGWTKWGPSVTARVLPAVDVPSMPLIIALLPEAPLENDGPSPAVGVVKSSSAVAAPIDWEQIVVGLYLTGVALMLARLAAGMIHIRRMVRRSRAADGFRVTDQCGAPVTTGWWRPVLLLPEDWREWSASKLDAVLIHEREHIRRRDPLVQWLALLNRCVFWFHPVAWWIERTLSALSEEACDAAVLRRGHTAQDYSGYLIEIARSVNARGARLAWTASMAFSSGKLARRVRWMMEAEPKAPPSSTMRVAAAVCCTSILALCMACGIGHQAAPASALAPGQPTMAQLEESQRARAEAGREEQHVIHEAMAFKALHLTDAQAKSLEANVHLRPDDLDTLWIVTDHYERTRNTKALDALTFWYIEQHPEMRKSWDTRPAWDQVWDEDIYARGRDLWAQQLKKSSDNPYFYMNAAEYLSGHDNEMAEQALLEGQRRFPARGQYAGLHWDVLLARHYAWALVGHKGQMYPGPLGEVTPFPAPSPYAQKVRALLLASNDDELLGRVADMLPVNWQDKTLARALSDRAVELNPSEPFNHVQNIALKQRARLRQIPRDLNSQTDSDRIVLLLSRYPSRFPFSRPMELDAWQLLALAAKNPQDPNAGTAVFLGNMILGYAALNRGDKWEAVRRMKAAGEAPVNEYLRYRQIDMLLAAKLLDWGQREAVANFLDRCAKFSSYGRRYSQWAAMIRRGVNPPLFPVNGLYRPA